MKFNLFMYCIVGRRAELEAGMAGKNPELYQRMITEIGEYARFADQSGFSGFGHPEHHMQIEGFEISNEPTLMGMWLGSHSEKLRIITCGFVSTTHNPLRTAESIATMDHMLGGRFGVGLVRGYQHRWLENFKIRDDLAAVGPWNKDTPVDDMNREYFAEFVDIVLTALREDTFSYRGQFWDFPRKDDTNPHEHPVYSKFGQGVSKEMKISEVGIAPRPLQYPHPPLYGGFTHSLRTAKFWAKYKGKPIVLANDFEFCKSLWAEYRTEAQKHGHDIKPGQEAGWGGIMICAETDEKAQAWAEDMRWFWNAWSTPFGQGLPELLIGSPDTLTRRIEEASGAVPIEETFLLIPQGLHTRDQIMHSLDLFASKVIPRFSDASPEALLSGVA